MAAPCVLPLLPVIIGGSLVRGGSGKAVAKDRKRPLVICASLVVSIVIFTLLLKATTSLLGVPQGVWSGISGLIVMLLGLTFALPKAWERLSARINLSGKGGRLLARTNKTQGYGGDVLLGAALGPAFNSCSPTYALIVATILPASFAEGFAYLLAYAAGLAGALLMVVFLGQGIVRRMGWLANPHGRFRQSMGVLLVAVGIAVVFGVDRDIQTFVLEQGWYDPVANFERQLGL